MKFRVVLVLALGLACVLGGCLVNHCPTCPPREVLLLSGERPKDFVESGEMLSVPHWNDGDTYRCYFDMEHGNAIDGVWGFVLRQAIDGRPYRLLRIKADFMGYAEHNAWIFCDVHYLNYSWRQYDFELLHIDAGPEQVRADRTIWIDIPMDGTMPLTGTLQISVTTQMHGCVSNTDCTGSARCELRHLRVYGVL